MRKFLAKVFSREKEIAQKKDDETKIWAELFREQLKQLKNKGIPISLVTI